MDDRKCDRGTLRAVVSLLDRMPPRWVLLVLFCLALVVRGRVMLSMSDSLRPDPDGYREVAWNVYDDGIVWAVASRCRPGAAHGLRARRCIRWCSRR